MIAECKSCKAKIVWMKTKIGKNIPVDWEEGIDKETLFDYAHMTSHFATCPNAMKHRNNETKNKTQ